MAVSTALHGPTATVAAAATVTAKATARCRPLSPFHSPPPLNVLSALDACKETLANKEAAKVKKDVEAQKRHGMQVLNSINVPLAKFEADVAALRSAKPGHSLTPALDAILLRGAEIKAAANSALKGPELCKVSRPEVAGWLAEVRANSKAVQALLKAKGS